jgi:orotidine-5'-phosphate decarboxylase
MKKESGGPRVIVALDYPDAAAALGMVEHLDPARCRVKVGNELFTAAGPAFVQDLVRRGYSVFLDLKYHDIPNTVASASAAAAALGVWMLNVHASGGRAMMEAARDAVAGRNPRPLLIAVTLLTSMGERDRLEAGIAGNSAVEVVVRLAKLAQASGMDGVVCSAQEAAAVRQACGAGFRLVTPGIRPAQAGEDDQKRVATPGAAVASGADYLVVGRPVTRAPDPLAALAAIESEIAGGGPG